MNSNQEISSSDLAKRIRIHALRMTSRGGSSHIGAVFSIADILAVLYGGVLDVRPSEPKWPDRDRFILSKGHAGAGVYAALAESGFFDIQWLETHYQDGSRLSGHVTHVDMPGVELSTGSLGHGLGVGCGMAYGAKLDGKNHRVVVLCSDGELDEGSNWEPILFAGHHKLSNLIAVIDYNKIQSLAPVSDTIALEPLADKFRVFGWAVYECNGHEHDALRAQFAAMKEEKGKPKVLLAHTTKGKGVSFMENTVLWHYRTARGEEFDRALAELEAVR
ncbi:MAG: transketolase [Armatimonadetes bacterium]|nr:transketolase [Armatimonadota bacterium]